MRRQGEFWFAGVCMAMGGYAALASLPSYWDGKAVGPGYFPFWEGTALLVCGLALLPALRRGRAQSAAIVPLARRRFLVTALSMIAYVPLTLYAGFGIASFLYLLANLRLVGRYGWWLSLTLSLLIAILCAEAFRTLLDIPLPRGTVLGY